MHPWERGAPYYEMSYTSTRLVKSKDKNPGLIRFWYNKVRPGRKFVMRAAKRKRNMDSI